MVCSRCIMMVESELEKFGLHPILVELGTATTLENLNKDQEQLLNKKLVALGFEIIDDKKSRVVEKVKNLITDLVYFNDNHFTTNLSDYIVSSIVQDYSHISSVFSQQENTTIEQYYIFQKIERVKELLVYDELSLNEIAFKLHYSSPSHLSKQFKKVTGLTPTCFKNAKEQKRKSLENL
jgi:AraC-like DNA-binding protein